MVTDDSVFSAWSKKYQHNLYNVEWAVERLVGMGLPASAIEHCHLRETERFTKRSRLDTESCIPRYVT